MKNIVRFTYLLQTLFFHKIVLLYAMIKANRILRIQEYKNTFLRALHFAFNVIVYSHRTSLKRTFKGTLFTFYQMNCRKIQTFKTSTVYISTCFIRHCKARLAYGRRAAFHVVCFKVLEYCTVNPRIN